MYQRAEGKTHSAPRAVTPTRRAILAILVLARARQIPLDLNRTGIHRIRRRAVGLNRQPRRPSTRPNSEIDGRVVPQRLPRAAPLAGIARAVPGRVEVVLRGCGFTLPHVVVARVGAGERLGGACLNFCGDGLGLGAGIVGPADGHDGPGVVLRVDVAGAGHAEGGAERGVGEVQHSA